MEKLIQVADDRFPGLLGCLGKGWWHGARWSQQSFNKPSGLLGVQLDFFALADDLPGGFKGMNDHKFSHRTALKRGRLAKKLLVRRRDASDKPAAPGLFCDRLHVQNVCLQGTHCKAGFASLDLLKAMGKMKQKLCLNPGCCISHQK